jgi:two-component sensor histidine kinase
VALYSFGGAIHLECDIAPIEMVAKKLMPVGIIVNELVTNALKYAFRGRERGTISVSAEKRENILLTVADDGVGMSDDVLEGRIEKGFGLELVRLLVKQLNGSMRFEAKNGTRIEIEFE